jgi:hypothetical protein
MVPGIPLPLQAATRAASLAMESKEFRENLRRLDTDKAFLNVAMRDIILSGGPGANELNMLKVRMCVVLEEIKKLGIPQEYGSELARTIDKYDAELAHIKAQMVMICGHNSAGAHHSNTQLN